MEFPVLRQLYYHRDYDGIVAAAMVQASAREDLELTPVQYATGLNWADNRLGPETGVVGFLFHADAVLWVDHHETTFSTEAARLAFCPDPFHAFVPSAPSCPAVIAELPWFERRERWEDYIHWANVIDSAAYESPAQANDFSNPHVLLSHMIAEVDDVSALAALVRAIGNVPAIEALDLDQLRPARTNILQNDARFRERLAEMLRVVGRVAILDQADVLAPYRRYLAYERYPDIHYGVGLYRTDENVIVSVGENPWNRSGAVHLGHLCREFGGGGRSSTAGVPVASIEEARELAATITRRLNDALRAEHSR